VRTFRLFHLVVVIVCAMGDVAQGGALDEIYDEGELAALPPRYERGWRDNYDNALSPVFTDAERSRFANVRFRLERRVPDSEPFGFMAGGDQVIASVASLKFLEDVALAYTWLDMTGRSTGLFNAPLRISAGGLYEAHRVKSFFRGVFRLDNCQQPLPRDGACGVATQSVCLHSWHDGPLCLAAPSGHPRSPQGRAAGARD
jgi:hypothetical protein